MWVDDQELTLSEQCATLAGWRGGRMWAMTSVQIHSGVHSDERIWVFVKGTLRFGKEQDAGSVGGSVSVASWRTL